jgi:hypothetical protein
MRSNLDLKGGGEITFPVYFRRRRVEGESFAKISRGSTDRLVVSKELTIA